MKNKGYTLIELVIVISIIAVALTLMFLSINNIFAFDVRKTSRELVSELEKEKVACMTRTGDVYMRLYKTDSGVYIDKYENDVLTERGINIGKRTVTIAYKSATSAVTPLDAAGIYIAFNRSAGQLMTIGQAARLSNPTATPPFDGEYYTTFIISSADRSVNVVLAPQTGHATIS